MTRFETGAAEPASVQRPTGPAVAALVSAALACATLGVLIVLAEASPAAKSALNLYDPVGPLSGKATGTVAVYALSWLILHVILRRKDMRLGPWLILTFILVLAGLVLSFPPVYDLFAAE